MTHEEFIAKMDKLWEEIGQSEEINKRNHRNSVMGTPVASQEVAKFNNCGTLRNQYGLPIRYVAMVELGDGKFYSSTDELNEINQHLGAIGNISEYFNIVTKKYMAQATTIFTSQLQMFNVLNGKVAKLQEAVLDKYPDFAVITEMKAEDDSTGDDISSMLNIMFTAEKTELEPNPITESFDYKIVCKDFVLFIMKGDAPDRDLYGESGSIFDKMNVILVPRKASDDFFYACATLYKILQAAPANNFVDFKYSIDEARAIGEFYNSKLHPIEEPDVDGLYNLVTTQTEEEA